MTSKDLAKSETSVSAIDMLPDFGREKIAQDLYQNSRFVILHEANLLYRLFYE